METRKLELKDICGYLPYGLKMQYQETGVIDECSCVTGLDDFAGVKLTIGFSNDEHIWMYKLILRPLSDLYKTITHNGKEIVPIVECFNKILIIGNKNLDGNSAYDSISRNWLSLDCDNNFIIQYMLSGNKVYDNISTKDNLRLLDYLYELKIDYRGLIDADLAVDVNTLSVNPYK